MATSDRTAGEDGPAPDDNSAIELREVTKRYRSGTETIVALDEVSLGVRPGEMVTIIGPSGSGKSTMLNVLGLLDAPTEGRVYLAGKDLTNETEKRFTVARRQSIGFVFQDFYLLPTLSAVENVMLPTMYADSTGNRRDRAKQLLQRVGLGDRLTHRPTELSGGQKQRVAIARSLINDPPIVLADEPTGNLDQDTGRTILEEFTRIKAEENVAIIVVTHDELLEQFTDRTIELVDGVIQE